MRHRAQRSVNVEVALALEVCLLADRANLEDPTGIGLQVDEGTRLKQLIQTLVSVVVGGRPQAHPSLRTAPVGAGRDDIMTPASA